MKKTALGFSLSAVVFFAKAQDRSTALLSLMKKAGVPGLSLAYVKNGKVREHYALGVRCNEAKQPVNDSTVFSAASLSKSVFAYAVFGLVREKKLDLDKPLYTYYNYKGVASDPRSKRVTARIILSHSSGLSNWRDDDSLHFRLDPGERFSYSGEGMVWLNKVVEAVTGKDIESYTKEKIFQPLAMTHTSCVWQKDFGDNYALPHIGAGQTVSKYFTTRTNVAQSLQTIAADYAMFFANILPDENSLTAFLKASAVNFANHLTQTQIFKRIEAMASASRKKTYVLTNACPHRPVSFGEALVMTKKGRREANGTCADFSAKSVCRITLRPYVKMAIFNQWCRDNGLCFLRLRPRLNKKLNHQRSTIKS